MTYISNEPLSKVLRTQLEATVKSARDIAEKGASGALSQLAVGERSAPDYLTDDLKALRRRLRAHGRALGDLKAKDDTQALQHLIWEVAYEHWHRMLFARFLAENGLLLWEPGAAVSLDDCEALVHETDPVINLGAKTKWELAGKLAARMLPQVFKPQSPVFELDFAPEHQRELERLLAALPPDVFKASDSLGWVYQFWQAKRKDEVNASEVKIGADELPAVTQLFTEPYMVDFLLHNSLGAWWVTRHPGKACPVPLTYLRTLEDGTPAAGKFEGWPDQLNEFRLLDPCCGSGHFLVAAFLMLVPMRMAAEGLTAMDAVDYVLQDNIHGLELDSRCVEIAVFALALAAWRFPDENGDPLGVRSDMPAPQVACCGLKVAAKAEDWMGLVPEDAPNADYLRQELRLLHSSFVQAPLLGSLLDPARSLKNDLATSSFDTLRDLVGQALGSERSTSELHEESWDLAITAKGLLDAARLLDTRYHLVVTNVPYRSSNDLDPALNQYFKEHYPEASTAIETVFLQRCLELCTSYGSSALVLPQDWLFKTSYESLRKTLLAEKLWHFICLLGPKAFQTPMWDFNVQLILLSNLPCGASQEQIQSNLIAGLDLGAFRELDEKIEGTRLAELEFVLQNEQLSNPDTRISLHKLSSSGLLGLCAKSVQGIKTGDDNRVVRYLWELSSKGLDWVYYQSTVSTTQDFGGLERLLYWGDDGRSIARRQGNRAWGVKGLAVSQMAKLPSAVYLGEKFDSNMTAIVPAKESDYLPLLAYGMSGELGTEVRKLDSSLKPTNSSFEKIPYDNGHWSRVAKELFPNGAPAPYTNDPTQWLFHGHPLPSTDPLQVAVARLMGYRWPAETDSEMELADDARTWISNCEALTEHVDDDGIVCLPSVRGEVAAHDRLLKLLISAWETVQPGSWKPVVLDKLLAEADCAGKGLDVWLRDKFFEQHAKRFHHRPFIWHVWDGLKDGFAALVNYHQLDNKNLERLVHTYLGDWIRQQEAGVRDGIDGAQQRLAAAQDLKRRLELILEGEAPYDIFVRWKPLAEQPIGWNPDLNDGVRLNIRPFMAAEVLRHNKKPKLNISWDKDRGKDVASAPWFKVFQGDRINDHHLTLAQKKS